MSLVTTLFENIFVMAWSQVRKRPLNKKELAKNEEDIITIEQHSNSLIVHETKLKVCIRVWFMWCLV